MCKIFCLAGITAETRAPAWKLIEKMADKISAFRNDDGLGYAALTEEGNLFGERWFYNKEAFSKRSVLTDTHKTLITKLGDFILGDLEDAKYNSFGKVETEKLAAITLHARFATSAKGFLNTHPFVLDGTSLIHNGVIANTSELEMTQSTCDSECILNEYVRHDVINNPKAIQKVANILQGYYACGVFAKNDKGEYFLDIFKSEGAKLYAGFVKELNTLVYTTDYDDLEHACRMLDFHLEGKYPISAGVLARINPITGDAIHKEVFKDEYKPLGGTKVVRNDDDEFIKYDNWMYHVSTNTYYRRDKAA